MSSSEDTVTDLTRSMEGTLEGSRLSFDEDDSKMPTPNDELTSDFNREADKPSSHNVESPEDESPSVLLRETTRAAGTLAKRQSTSPMTARLPVPMPVSNASNTRSPKVRCLPVETVMMRRYLLHFLSEGELKVIDEQRREPPMTREDVKKIEDKVCLVCSAPFARLYYGKLTCEGCKGFFKRAVQGRKTFKCYGLNENNCDIRRKQKRNVCKKCRFRKCLLIGMAPADVPRENTMKAVRNLDYSSISEDEKEEPQLPNPQMTPLKSLSASTFSTVPEELAPTFSQVPQNPDSIQFLTLPKSTFTSTPSTTASVTTSTSPGLTSVTYAASNIIYATHKFNFATYTPPSSNCTTPNSKHATPNTSNSDHTSPYTFNSNHTTPQMNYVTYASPSSNYTTPNSKHATPNTSNSDYASPYSFNSKHATPNTSNSDHATPNTSNSNHATPNTSNFNHATPNTSNSNHATPNTFNSKHATPNTFNSKHATLYTFNANHATPNTSNSNHATSHMNCVTYASPTTNYTTSTINYTSSNTSNSKYAKYVYPKFSYVNYPSTNTNYDTSNYNHTSPVTRQSHNSTNTTPHTSNTNYARQNFNYAAYTSPNSNYARLNFNYANAAFNSSERCRFYANRQTGQFLAVSLHQDEASQAPRPPGYHSRSMPEVAARTMPSSNTQFLDNSRSEMAQHSIRRSYEAQRSMGEQIGDSLDREAASHGMTAENGVQRPPAQPSSSNGARQESNSVSSPQGRSSAFQRQEIESARSHNAALLRNLLTLPELVANTVHQYVRSIPTQITRTEVSALVDVLKAMNDKLMQQNARLQRRLEALSDRDSSSLDDTTAPQSVHSSRTRGTSQMSEPPLSTTSDALAEYSARMLTKKDIKSVLKICKSWLRQCRSRRIPINFGILHQKISDLMERRYGNLSDPDLNLHFYLFVASIAIHFATFWFHWPELKDSEENDRMMVIQEYMKETLCGNGFLITTDVEILVNRISSLTAVLSSVVCSYGQEVFESIFIAYVEPIQQTTDSENRFIYRVKFILQDLTRILPRIHPALILKTFRICIKTGEPNE